MKSIWIFLLATATLLITLFKIYPNLLLLILLLFLFAIIFYKLKGIGLLLLLIHALILLKVPIYGVNVNIFDSCSFLLKHIPDRCKSFVKLFLFNEKSSSKLYNYSKELGITYLVVVSGLHFNFLYRFLYKITNHFLNEIITNIIIFCLLFGYLCLLNFSISATRAFVMLLLGVINKEVLKSHFNKIDIFSITLLGMLLISPNIVNQYSFIFSFSLTFVIVVCSNYIKLNLFKLSLLAFITSIPIQIHLNGYINLLTPIYSAIFAYPYLIAILLSLSILLFPFLGYLFKYYFLGVKKLTFLCSKFTFILHISYSNKFIIFLYYLILLLFMLSLEKKQTEKIIEKMLAIALVTVICFVKPYGENPYEITFLNVYQGDSICFTSKYSRKAYLVDTGGIQNFDVSSKILIPFLKSKNIKYIDKVVITHNDYDHSGALEALKNNFEVRNVLYELNDVNFFKYNLRNINKKHYASDNDNSIVLYGNYANIKLILTGDISSTVDKDIIKNYSKLKIDVLKVAHHGSKYSTSTNFLDTYKPKISIISYGKNNYGHPHTELVKRLNDAHSLIFTTYEHGNLTLKYKYKAIEIYSSKRKKVYYVN